MVPDSVEIKEECFNFDPVNFIFDNIVKYWTDDTIPRINYKNAIDTTHHVNEIINNNIITGKTFLPSYGKVGEVISAQVKYRYT